MPDTAVFRVDRRDYGCVVCSPDGSCFLSMIPQSRPIMSLAFACLIGFVCFIVTLFPAYVVWESVFEPAGPTSNWHGLSVLTTAGLAGICFGAFALRWPGYRVVCHGDEFSLCPVGKTYRLLDSAGEQITLLDRSDSRWHRHSWRAIVDGCQTVLRATETNRVPRYIRGMLRFSLAVVIQAGTFASLYFVLVEVLGMGLTMSLLVTQIVVMCLLWLSKISNLFQSTVSVSIGDRRVAHIENRLGASNVVIYATQDERGPPTEFLYVVLAVLVYL
jgi:hypothetical protein